VGDKNTIRGKEYLDRLEAASADHNIFPFAKFIREEMNVGLDQRTRQNVIRRSTGPPAPMPMMIMSKCSGIRELVEPQSGTLHISEVADQPAPHGAQDLTTG